MTKWTIVHGNILEQKADVLVVSANPQLNLSGGVGGAFMARYGVEMQNQLHELLDGKDVSFVQQGEVICMPALNSPYKAVLHAVGIDVFYDSNADVIRATIERALQTAASIDANSVALTAIATGYGRVTWQTFANGLLPILDRDFQPIEDVYICVSKMESIDELARQLPMVSIDKPD